MQAIQTKYLGPTNYRGSRFKAKCAAGSLTVSYDYSLNSADNHKAAAEALRVKLGWKGSLESGCLSDGTYCHVFTSSKELADAVIQWAETPMDHGGNPYCHDFVRIAQEIRGAS